MIFTTKNKELAIFGKTIDEIKKKWSEFVANVGKHGLFGESGAFASLFSGKKSNNILTPEVLNQFKEFKEKFNSSSLSAEALAEQMENIDQRIIDYAKTCKNGSMTTEGFKASVEGMSLSAQAGQIALKGLAIAGNMLAMWAVTKVITLSASAINNWMHSIDNAKNELDEANSSLDEVNSELEEVSSRIDELNAKQNLSLIEADELDRLKETNMELERELRIREELSKVKSEKANKEALLYFNPMSGTITGSFWAQLKEDLKSGDFFRPGSMDVSPKFFNKIDEAEHSIDLLENLKQSLNGMEYTESDEYKDTLSVIEDMEAALASTILDFMEKDDLLIKGQDDGYLAKLDALYEKYDIYTSGRGAVVEKTISGILEKADFEGQKEQLIELGQKGELSVAAVTSRFPRLIEYLGKAGVSAGELYQYIMSLAGPDAVNYDAARQQLYQAIGLDQAGDRRAAEITQDFNENGLFENNALEAFLTVKSNFTDGETEYWNAGDWKQHIQDELDKTRLSGEAVFSFDTENFAGTVSEITSACSTLTSAVAEYNENGAYSLNTVSRLLSLSPEYLALLVTENGQLALNEQGLRSLAEAQLQQAEAGIYAAGIAKLKALADEQTGTASENAASRMAGSAEDIDAQTKAYNENTLAAAANAAIKDGADKSDVDSVVEETENQVKAIQNAVKGLTFDIGGVTGGFRSGASSASKTMGDTLEDMQSGWKDYLDKYLALYDAELDAGLTDFNTCLNKSRALLDEYYQDSRIAPADYWNYVGSLYEKQLDTYGKALSAVTRRIDREIGGLRDLIDGLEEQNETLEKQKDNYDSLLSVVDSVYEAEIDRIRSEQDAIQDNIDALQDENDERELSLKLEQAKYDLYKAQTQRTRKVFNGTEFVYETDRDAVRDAQETLSDLTLEQTVSGLEAEKDALDTVIEELEYYQSLWAGIPDAYEDERNKQLAMDQWGEDYIQRILSNQTSDIDSFKDDYTSVQETISANQELIDSCNEKIESYEALKEQWSSVADAYGQAQEDQYAAMILGAEWESDVLSGRLDTLEHFRDEYISIQEAIADAAWKAANAAASAAEASASPAPSGADSGSGDKGAASSAKYKVVDETGNVLAGFSGAGAKSDANNYKNTLDDAIHDPDDIKIVPYASGTTHARKGLNLVGENGAETYISRGGSVSLVTKPSLIPMEGGETVINAAGTKSLLDPRNLTPAGRPAPAEALASGSAPALSPVQAPDGMITLYRSNGDAVRLDMNEFRQRLQGVMPDYSSMLQPVIHMPEYKDIFIHEREVSPSISIGNIHLHEVQKVDSLAEAIIRELPGKTFQAIHRRK